MIDATPQQIKLLKIAGLFTIAESARGRARLDTFDLSDRIMQIINTELHLSGISDFVSRDDSESICIALQADENYHPTLNGSEDEIYFAECFGLICAARFWSQLATAAEFENYCRYNEILPYRSGTRTLFDSFASAIKRCRQMKDEREHLFPNLSRKHLQKMIAWRLFLS
ncbi:hypothetical protein ACFA67_004536 [Salmonella enterica]